MIKTILYIHQSAELYGSDKALYFLVKAINDKPNFNVIVVLPNNGPLKDLLESCGIKVLVFPVIKVSREMFTLRNMLYLPFNINSKTKELKKVLGDTKVDIVHSNTLAVLLGAFYAKRYRIKHIWHIHEIIKKPKIVRFFYPILVQKLTHLAVFNSKASRDFLCENNQKLTKKAIVNLNGMDREVPQTSAQGITEIRRNLFEVSNEDIVLGLVGRISKWKGQHLLLEVFNKLQTQYTNLKLMFVGSAPPNQEYLVNELESKIKQFNLESKCKIISFQTNIWSIWDSLDLAIVSSTEPEPFGLVAIEAMLSKKPVIAAKHGGLLEIVEDGQTGYFFEPNNTTDLEEIIIRSISNPDRLERFGMNGYERAKSHFSFKSHLDRFIDIYENL